MSFDKESYRGNRGGNSFGRKDQPPRTGGFRDGVPKAVNDDGPENRYQNRNFRDNRPKEDGYNRNYEGHRPERPSFERKYDNRRSDRPDFERRHDERSFDRPDFEWRHDDRSFDRPDFERRHDEHRSDRPAFERKYDNRRSDRPDYDRPPQPERRVYAAPKSGSITPRPAAFRPAPAPVTPVMPEAAEEELTDNLLVGRNPIREAIKAGREIEKLLVARGDLSGSAREIVAKAKEARIVVQEVDKARLDAIYPNHQGMLAYVSAAHYAELDDIFEAASEKNEDPFVIVLDGVTDPHNLGAIIRTAECVGAHGVIIPERRSVGLTPAAVKASAGACEYMNVVRVVNINRTLEQLKERGLWIVGTTMDGEDAFKADLTGPVALVIGAEGEGISELTLKKCDLKLRLPMKGHLDSLNASVAAGVMMYAVVNARRG